MPERRSHVKSRLGCSQCKARRVKCDEIRPTCGNCRRRQEACSYKNARQNVSPSPTSPAGSEQANYIPPTLHSRQLELMHQWSTETCFTLAMRSTGTTRHQIEIPRLALIHDCLLDTVFALTSLHIAYLRPHDARSYIADAVRYQARALSSTRQKVENLTGSECEALYHASGQLGAIALAFRSVDPESVKASKPTETLSQLAQLWRGTQLILTASEDLIDTATLHGYLPKLNFSPRDPPTFTSQTHVFLERLRARAKSGEFGEGSRTSRPSDEEVSTTYLEAMYHLEKTIAAQEDDDPSRTLVWIVQAGPRFMDFLTQGQPLAQATVLLYSMLMGENFENTWWTRKLRRQLVDELAPSVAACDPDLAEIADYVQSWTKPAEEMARSTSPYDPAMTETSQWPEHQTMQEHDMGSSHAT